MWKDSVNLPHNSAATSVTPLLNFERISGTLHAGAPSAYTYNLDSNAGFCTLTV